jgi:hypothetical protein
MRDVVFGRARIYPTKQYDYGSLSDWHVNPNLAEVRFCGIARTYVCGPTNDMVMVRFLEFPNQDPNMKPLILWAIDCIESDLLKLFLTKIQGELICTTFR